MIGSDCNIKQTKNGDCIRGKYSQNGNNWKTDWKQNWARKKSQLP